MKLLMLFSLAAITVGCGYSKSTMPATPGTVPVIAQLNPSSVAAMSPALPFEVDGASFGAKAVINFNGSAMATSVVSSGKLTTTIPASALTTPGIVPVTVTNPGTPGGIYGGGTSSATSAPMNFQVK
jgi:hypothetical protein